MWYRPTVTAPANEPITLLEAKRHVYALDFPDDDDILKGLIGSARSHAERYCSAMWAPQEFAAKATGWSDFCELPVFPVTSIASISYVDADGVTQTLPSSVYELRGDAIVLKPGQSWPVIDTGTLITLTAVAGFDPCPPDVKHAMLLWIAEAYQNRESAKLSEWATFDALLCNHRY